MKLLGLMMVRNGADRVTRALDGMQGFCDEVYVIDSVSNALFMFHMPELFRKPGASQGVQR